MLFKAVNIKVFRMVCGFVSDRLIGQVNFDLSIRIVLNGREQFLQERF